mmetsp:Transcript_11897/g.38043  ORF Transcript_11897/g.38043 Transcript_11897/m.38043 type:complete len:257 (-) Transcript_11897:207-977(-)
MGWGEDRSHTEEMMTQAAEMDARINQKSKKRSLSRHVRSSHDTITPVRVDSPDCIRSTSDCDDGHGSPPGVVPAPSAWERGAVRVRWMSGDAAPPALGTDRPSVTALPPAPSSATLGCLGGFWPANATCRRRPSGDPGLLLVCSGRRRGGPSPPSAPMASPISSSSSSTASSGVRDGCDGWEAASCNSMPSESVCCSSGVANVCRRQRSIRLARRRTRRKSRIRRMTALMNSASYRPAMTTTTTSSHKKCDQNCSE